MHAYIDKILLLYDKCMHTKKICSFKEKKTCHLGIKSIIAKIN